MIPPSPEKLLKVLYTRDQVYGLQVDSLLRQAANRMSALALFHLLDPMDDESPDFPAALKQLCDDFCQCDPSVLIGLDTGCWDDLPNDENQPGEDAGQDAPVSEHYLKLIFRNEEAAYYQFNLFPDLNAGYVRGAARKRELHMQHLRLELSDPKYLQVFIESLRGNPHFSGVEESTEQEFWAAPSNAV